MLIVQRGQPDRVELPGGATTWRYPVPPSLQPLLKRAQADPDERVRHAAAVVGK